MAYNDPHPTSLVWQINYAIQTYFVVVVVTIIVSNSYFNFSISMFHLISMDYILSRVMLIVMELINMVDIIVIVNIIIMDVNLVSIIHVVMAMIAVMAGINIEQTIMVVIYFLFSELVIDMNWWPTPIHCDSW